MRNMTRTGALVGLAAGIAVTAAVFVAPDAAAKSRRRGAVLKVIDCNVGGLDGVYQNAVIELTFTTAVDPASVNPAVFQIRQRNATGKGYTIQVPGSFQPVGSVVRFYPRLPTHLRDPASLAGDFYGPGTPRDNAVDNAGFKPSTSYEVRVVGGGSASAARSVNGRRLVRPYVTHFTTTPAAPASDAFTTDTYGDSPPPGFRFSNPADKVASALDQYARHGGTRDVPNAISVTLFGNRVPVSPSSLRKTGNVTLTQQERNGDPALTKPIRGNPFVEQNFDGVRIVYKPVFPLPDRGTFSLRFTKDVKDLTEQYDFLNNPERLRLREIFEFMETAQQLSPSTPPELLPSPPIELIFDWPTDETERGPLKANILALGQAYPYEVDPRVMVIFSTRDEPVSNGSVVLEFQRNDGHYDPVLSTASYDEVGQVPGAASAVLTVAAGTGVDGDYSPVVNETINVDNYPNRTVNWRKVTIPANVTISIQGTRPATLKCFEMQLDGTIAADGRNGVAQSSTNNDARTLQKGGLGGPGGGDGGDSATAYGSNAKDGNVGVDGTGAPLAPADGGRGGKYGAYPVFGSSSYYAGGGGGGGGGARLAGENGANVAGSGSSPSWVQGTAGGLGGAGSSNDDLQPLGGGAGGGAGGNSQYYSNGWAVTGASGGGGGGAILIQSSGTVTIGTTGLVRSRGGQGGKGASWSTYYDAGPGGGGGGGSVLLRSTRGFNFANAGAATDVRGGARGTGGGGTYSWAAYGGAGGAGYVRTEDPSATDSGILGASAGSYDPVGGGAPSVVYTKWLEIGVDQPRFMEYTQNDFILNAAGNDAILIEMQAAIEDVKNFGSPLLTAIDQNQNSRNTAEVSQWTPIRIVDLTGTAGGAFGAIPGYNQSIHGTDHIFPIAAILNDKSYRFFRVRIRFQLDNTQSIHEPFPFVDRMIVNFQFNI